MNNQTSTVSGDDSVWTRLLFAILFAFLFYFAQILLGAVVVVQFLARLLTGRTVSALGRLGQGLASYFYGVMRFLTFGSDEMPWPFSAWSSESPEVAVRGNDAPDAVDDDNLLRRLVHIILFTVAFNLSMTVLAVLVVVQFLWKIATGDALTRGAQFGQSLASFVYEVVLFLTYRTDELPWPFAPWPEGAPSAHSVHVERTVIVTPPPRSQRRRPNLANGDGPKADAPRDGPEPNGTN